MKEITSHKVNGLNNELCIMALGEPGHGGAFNKYQICSSGVGSEDPSELLFLKFQEGPIDEVYINGISNEALLAIVEHRLQGFQSGEYSCRENAIALTKLQEAQMWLKRRTEERIARGVEGTHAV